MMSVFRAKERLCFLGFRSMLAAVCCAFAVSCSRPAPSSTEKKTGNSESRPTAALDNDEQSKAVPRTVMRSLQPEDQAASAVSQHPNTDVPDWAEAPVPPRDYLIGLLGPGDGKTAPYREAVSVLNGLVGVSSRDLRVAPGGGYDAATVAALVAGLGDHPSARAGSQISHPDGNVSFLVRLVGKEASLSGELILTPAGDGSWAIESLTLDEDEAAASSKFDPLTYKRFL